MGPGVDCLPQFEYDWQIGVNLIPKQKCLNKMADIWQLVHAGLIDNKSSFVEVKVWCWTGSKPLHKPMTQSTTEVYFLGFELDPGGIPLLTISVNKRRFPP